MMDKKWLGAVGVLVLGVLAWGGYGLSGAPAVTQPIQFPHKTHVEAGLECTNCHVRAEEGLVAGRPPTEFCLACHSDGEAEGELKKLQVFAESGEQIPWRRVWRLPRHVFFPHRTHVVVAQVKCQTCHGPMETLERPPERPLKTLTMSDCIRCHERWQWPEGMASQPVRVGARQGVSTDCNACHR